MSSNDCILRDDLRERIARAIRRCFWPDRVNGEVELRWLEIADAVLAVLGDQEDTE